MPRHSFIQMTKLHNVMGRIDYITSTVKQENLYAIYATQPIRSFWKDLAKCNREEFAKSGTIGKYIEARELIIALPEGLYHYEHDYLIKHFATDFKKKYGVDCYAALHHNKRKTNFHIHLIFAERTKLEKPVVKVASRNMFYDERGKHVRTKKEIFKEGKLKKKDIKNDTIIFKGEDNLHYEKFQDGTVKCIEDEIPFEVPEGWSWARLRDICMMSAGKSKSTVQIKSEPFEGSYPCFGGNGVRGYVDEYNQDGIFSIVGRQGALCGNINIAIGKFYATEHAVVTTLFDGIDFKWSNYILEALRLNNYATGAAQPGLSVANILNVFVPVPPTQEQDRIGNSVYESLKIVEALEQEKIDLQKNIITAKTKILDLAICGKLVPQDPNDEPASVLLERIRAEKEELIKHGKIKRDKKESVIFKGDDNP